MKTRTQTIMATITRAKLKSPISGQVENEGASALPESMWLNLGIF